MIHEALFTLVALGLLVGAMAKSAQIGLHTWLPNAMEGSRILLPTSPGVCQRPIGALASARALQTMPQASGLLLGSEGFAPETHLRCVRGNPSPAEGLPGRRLRLRRRPGGRLDAGSGIWPRRSRSQETHLRCVPGTGWEGFCLFPFRLRVYPSNFNHLLRRASFPSSFSFS